MITLIASAFAIVGLVIVVGLASVFYVQNRRFLAESHRWQNALSRRGEIEEAVRKKYPHAVVLPAWDIFNTDLTTHRVYTVTENLCETPEQIARRALEERSSGGARSRVRPAPVSGGGL